MSKVKTEYLTPLCEKDFIEVKTYSLRDQILYLLLIGVCGFVSPSIFEFFQRPMTVWIYLSIFLTVVLLLLILLDIFFGKTIIRMNASSLLAERRILGAWCFRKVIDLTTIKKIYPVSVWAGRTQLISLSPTYHYGINVLTNSKRKCICSVPTEEKCLDVMFWILQKTSRFAPKIIVSTDI